MLQVYTPVTHFAPVLHNNSSDGRLFGHHSYANELYCIFWLLIGWTFPDLVLSCLGKLTNRKYPKAKLGCSEIC